MKFAKLIAVVAVAILLATGVMANGKKLQVATDTAFVPFEFKQGNEYVGFDIDLWDAVAKELKIEYKLRPMDFNGIIPAIQTGNIDVALAGITITDQRKKVVAFSDPYYKSGLLIMVDSKNQVITKLADLDTKVVAVKSGTGSVDFVKQNTKVKELRQFPNIDNAYMELGTGRADAVVHDTPNILYFIKTAGNGKFKTVGNSLEAQDYGIAVNKNKTELVKQINQALQTLRTNGSYNQIYHKWFGTEPK